MTRSLSRHTDFGGLLLVTEAIRFLSNLLVSGSVDFASEKEQASRDQAASSPGRRRQARLMDGLPERVTAIGAGNDFHMG